MFVYSMGDECDLMQVQAGRHRHLIRMRVVLWQKKVTKSLEVLALLFHISEGGSRLLENPHITYGVICSGSRIWVGGWAKNLSSPCILQYDGCFLNFFLHSYDTRADRFCDTTCEECDSVPRWA